MSEQYYKTVIRHRIVEIDKKLPFIETGDIVQETMLLMENMRGFLPKVSIITETLKKHIETELCTKHIIVNVINDTGLYYNFRITGSAKHDMTEDVYKILRSE